jgi:hypothetical protein
MSTVLNLPEIYVQGKRVVHLWTHGVFTKCGRPVPPIGKGWTSTKLPPNVDVCRRCQRAP